MTDWGLLVVIIFSLLGGIQLLVNFVIEPFIKKRKGQNYKISKILVIFIFLYLIFMIIVFILACTGFIKYSE